MKKYCSLTIARYLCLIISCSLLVISWGCRGTAKAPEVKPPSKEQPGVVQPPEVPPETPEENRWKEIVRREEGKLALSEEQKRVLAESYYETGYKLFLELKYDEALDDFRKTLELNPNHQKAKQYAEEIVALKGGYVPGDVGTVAKHEIDRIIAIIEQSKLEVQNHLNKGIRYYEDEDYDGAEEEFQWVIETVKWLPYPAELAAFRKEAEGYLEKTRDKKHEKELTIKRQQAEQARRLAEAEERKRKEDFNRKIQMLFRQAQEEFMNERYEQTMSLCGKILDELPGDQMAGRMKEIAFAAQRAKVTRENRYNTAEQWKQVWESYDLKTIPPTKIVEFPDKETWRKISLRGPRRLEKTKSVSEEDRQTALLLRRKMLFPFEGGETLQNIVTFIQKQFEKAENKLNIRIDSAIDSQTNIVYRQQLPMYIALRDMLKSVNLGYYIQDGMVIITTQDDVIKSRMGTRTYDIMDLSLLEIPNYIGPSLSLTLVTPGQPDQPMPRIQGDQIIKLIKDNIEPATWGLAGDPIFDANTGTLTVTHTPEVHQRVEELLNGLRASMDIVVTVEARFLTVEENFLEDVGVDLRGLQGAPQLPAALQADPLATGAGAGAGTGFTDLTSGIYGLYSGGTRELRARVESTLNGDTLINQFQTQILSPSQTPVLSYTLLGQTQIQAMLKALEKRYRGRLLQSPKITAYNGQRVYVSIVEQFTYIKTYDLVVTIPDPVPTVLTLGTVLEVKPIVSADLRYIMVELKPSMSRLTPPWALPNLRKAHPLLNAPVIAAPWFELPDLQYQSVQTNVIMPDGGTVLIGGYMRGESLTASSEVPILSKIPLIGALFTSKPTMGNKEVNLILIKAYITILGQEEKERF